MINQRNYKHKNSKFKNRVYQWTKKIPRGRVASYGQIARLAGKPKSARAVGVFMKNNTDIPNTPCHRVVGFDGSLIGYSGRGGISQKKKILLEEGVFFRKNKVNLSLSQLKA